MTPPCCDGSLGDSCPCDCHSFVHSWDLDGAAVIEGFTAGIRAGAEEDSPFGLEWLKAFDLAMRAYLDPPPVHPLLDPASGRIAEALAEAPAQEVPPVDPDRAKRATPERIPATANGKVVGYVEGRDIVITDPEFMARLGDLGRGHVSIGPLDAPPMVSGLMIRPKS